MFGKIYEIECEQGTVTLERTRGGEIVFHNYDRDAAVAGQALGLPKTYCDKIYETVYGGDPNKLLTFAANRGDMKEVQLALWIGANPSHWNSWAMRRAAAGGHVQIAKLLIDHGADIAARKYDALYRAVENGHVDTVVMLLREGADPKHRFIELAENMDHDIIAQILSDAFFERYAAKGWDE
jgi:hypothetical protein